MFRKTLIILSAVLVLGCERDTSPTSVDPGPRPNDVWCVGASSWNCILYTKDNVSSDKLAEAKIATEKVANEYAKSLTGGSILVRTVVTKRHDGTYKVLSRVFHFFDDDTATVSLAPQE